jgi:hypothetical protein
MVCRLSCVFWNERRCFEQVTFVERVDDASCVLIMGGKENGGEGGKKGYIYSSYCDLIHILRFVG